MREIVKIQTKITTEKTLNKIAKFAKFNLKLFCAVNDKNFKFTKDGINIEKWCHYNFFILRWRLASYNEIITQNKVKNSTS